VSYFEGVDIIQAFEKAMVAAGIVPDFTRGGIVDDGKLIRFHIQGDKKGTRNGWCVLFGDGVPAGEFGSWKTGETHTWCAKEAGKITPEEQHAIRARIAAARAEREREERERQGEAARLANLLWQEGIPVTDDSHPYLIRKGVRAHGLRLVNWPVRNTEGKVFRTIADTLVIPILDKNGKIVSLQGVFPKTDAQFGRDKDFLVGGKKRGCFFMIGKPRESVPVALCEGYATGETIHQATGWCVVVAWDAYNLTHVAKVMREAMPTATFVIAADNDQFTNRPVVNPGLTYARQAAAEVGARVVFPEFASLEGEPTDFNDLASREGIEAVQACVLPPPPSTLPNPEGAKSTTLAPTAGGYIVPSRLMDFDTFTPFPEVDGKGKPLPTALNLSELCRRIGVIVRYNTIKKDVEILVPGLVTTIDNDKEVSTNEVYNCLHRVRMNVGGFESNLCSLAEANQYNPVATWIGSKAWDGKSRLQAFFDTVTAKSETVLPDGRKLKEVLMRKWLISAVAAAYEREGVVARGVLTFVSKQNLGKTRWAKQLAPRELGVIADGEVLNPSDKDSVMKIVSKWIVELGEVDATFRKADIAALKAFISKDSDSLRRPYARTESKYARRTVFFASVNDEQFLHDPTGNTRWWTIHAVALGEPGKLDMQQVWAEVKSLYDAGESWHLDPVELDALNGHNREHEAINPVHEMIDKSFDWDAARTLWTNAMIATDIAHAARFDKPTKKEVNEAAAYVVAQYAVETKRTGKSKSKHWMMPPRIRGGSAEPPL
jgi:putative DNA primase/helicase